MLFYILGAIVLYIIIRDRLPHRRKHLAHIRASNRARPGWRRAISACFLVTAIGLGLMIAMIPFAKVAGLDWLEPGADAPMPALIFGLTASAGFWVGLILMGVRRWTRPMLPVVDVNEQEPQP